MLAQMRLPQKVSKKAWIRMKRFGKKSDKAINSKKQKKLRSPTLKSVTLLNTLTSNSRTLLRFLVYQKSLWMHCTIDLIRKSLSFQTQSVKVPSSPVCSKAIPLPQARTQIWAPSRASIQAQLTQPVPQSPSQIFSILFSWFQGSTPPFNQPYRSVMMICYPRMDMLWPLLKSVFSRRLGL